MPQVDFTKFKLKVSKRTIIKDKETPSKAGYCFSDLKRVCVYAHYYDNEQEPFYIGQGSVQRAYVFTPSLRNKSWNTKVNDISKIHVKILNIDITIEESIELEKKYIKQYGRLDNNTGCLVNENDGGKNSQVGENNFFFGKHLGGANNGNYSNKYEKNSLSVPILQIDILGNIVKEWASATEASEIGHYQAGCISGCCLGKRHIHSGYQWIYKKDYDPNKDYSYKPSKTNSKIYLGWKLNELFVKEKTVIITCKEDSMKLGFNHSNVSQVANGKKKSHRGYYFVNYFNKSKEFKEKYMDLIKISN